MLTITISGRSWAEHPQAVCQLAQRFISGNHNGESISFDADTVAREAAMASGPDLCQHWQAHELWLSDWIKQGLAEDGVIDAHAIRQTPQGLGTDRPVILDARAHRADVILSVLPHLRHAWFDLQSWHPAFMVVVDDAYLLQVAAALPHTFYCLPQLPTEREVMRIVRHLQRRAKVNRWLGLGAGRVQKRFMLLIESMQAKLDARAEKRT